MTNDNLSSAVPSIYSGVNRRLQCRWHCAGGAAFVSGHVDARSRRCIAGVATAQRLPWLLFTLISGVVVDRATGAGYKHEFQRLSPWCFWPLALGAGLGRPRSTGFFAAAFLLGIAETLLTTRLCSVAGGSHAGRSGAGEQPHLHHADDCQRVCSRSGGNLFALAATMPLGLNVICYGLAATLVGLLPGPSVSSVMPMQPQPPLWPWARQEIAEGMRWFWGHRLLHLLGVKAAFEHGCWAATNALLVLVVQERLGMDAAGYGVLLAAGAARAVIMASWLIRRLGAAVVLLNLLIQSVAFAGIALSTNPLGRSAHVGRRQLHRQHRRDRRHLVPAGGHPRCIAGAVISAFRMYALGGMALGV
ncbi:MAG: hypothetical protein R3E79_27920 [Caldilineaceae bacterium]